MSPDTEKNINEAIDWLQQVGGSVQDFAVEQAPLYCREVIQWQIMSNTVGAAICALVLIAMVWVIKKFHEELEELVLLPFFLGVGTLILGVMCAVDAVKPVIAPRLVITEHLRGLK